jgi:WD40 repeat protein
MWKAQVYSALAPQFAALLANNGGKFDCGFCAKFADNRSEERCARFQLSSHMLLARIFAMDRLRSLRLPLVLLALGLLARGLAAEESKNLKWPSRIIQLKAESDAVRPPVLTALSLHSSGLLAAAGDDHLVRVWDLSKGLMVQRLEGHTDWVRSVAYSPTGEILASAGNDKRIIFWNALTGEKVKVFAEHPEAITMLTFSHDGRFLATTGFEDKIRIYEINLGKQVMELSADSRDMRALMYSPNDKYLAAGGRSGKVQVWNLENGEVVLEDEEHRQRIRSVEFSPDGTLLASCGEDRRIVVRNIATGAAPFVLPRRPAKIMAMTFYGNKQLASAGSDNLIRLWDLESQQEMGRLTGHTGTVAALVFGDKTLISTGFDTTIRVWSMEEQVAEQPLNTPRVGALPDAAARE